MLAVSRAARALSARGGARAVGAGTRWSTASAAVEGKDRLVVFDTTLRDGEQSPGATLNHKEKLEIAKQLSAMGIDVCEAGFPIASPGDFAAVKMIAETIGTPHANHGALRTALG